MIKLFFPREKILEIIERIRRYRMATDPLAITIADHPNLSELPRIGDSFYLTDKKKTAFVSGDVVFVDTNNGFFKLKISTTQYKDFLEESKCFRSPEIEENTHRRQ